MRVLNLKVDTILIPYDAKDHADRLYIPQDPGERQVASRVLRSLQNYREKLIGGALFQYWPLILSRVVKRKVLMESIEEEWKNEKVRP